MSSSSSVLDKIRSAMIILLQTLRKRKTMTMTKIPSRKACGTYGHGPLKICLGKEKDDDHDQDSLKKDFLHIWSWSSDYSSSDSLGPRLGAPNHRSHIPAFPIRRFGLQGSPCDLHWKATEEYLSQRGSKMGVRQRSGEGVVRRNGRPKGCFGESVSSLPT